MTQSDSPDFEFDISDLEVEREDTAPSMEGSGASISDPESVGERVAQSAEGESLKRESRADFDASDRELDVFEIDDLPDSSAPLADEQKPFDEPPAEAETGEASPIEVKPDPVSSRALGVDDLGADVFAEIETDVGSMGLEDVIDGLMDEVEEFEAGGFVELDEDGADSAAGAGSDGVFKMEDPDDSLGKSVDPNAVEEAPVSAPASFPSPPVDFEIPADPEPVRSSVEDVVLEAAPRRASPIDIRREEPKVAQRSDAPAYSAAKRPAPVIDPPAAIDEEASQPAAEPTVSSDFEIPADPEPEARTNPVSAGEVVFEEEAEPAEIMDELAESVSAEKPVEQPEQPEESRPPAEGHERVMFSAEDEEVEGSAEPPQAVEDVESTTDAPASEAPAAAEAELPAPSLAVLEDELEDASETRGAEDFSNNEGAETDDAAGEGQESLQDSDLFPGLVEVEEEEEDLSDLFDAISDSEEDEESGETIEEADSESAVQATGAGEAEAVEQPIVPGLVEVEEEEEDLSGLLDSIEQESDSAQAPGLAALADEEEAETIEGEEAASDDDDEIVNLPTPEQLASEASRDGEVPALIVEDDEEEVALPVPSVPGLVEVPEESDGSLDEDVPAASAPATAEELLMRAGSLLNGGSVKPVDGARALLDEIVSADDDDEEIIAMPSPEALISEASFADDDEVISLPDPMSLMTADGEAIAVIDDEEEEDTPAPGNVADRGGNLPPPPPPPVEILDEEPPEEDLLGADPGAEVGAFLDESSEGDEASGLEDPFAGEISLDDFSDGMEELAGSEEEDGIPLDDGAPLGDEPLGDNATTADKPKAPTVAEMPKPSLLWRVTHSMAIAAGLVLLGLTGIFAVWKQEIVEFYEGRDIDGSFLVHQIEAIGTHALSDFDEHGLYRMQWVDSEVRRVSENEIRLHALVGAQLKENLYKPVLESEMFLRKSYEEHDLMERLTYARDNFPEEIANYPDKPWDRLYEISASKEDVLPLRVTYSLKRQDVHSDWELDRIKVSGFKGDLEWPEGDPKFSFGENAYDIDSREFSKVYADYLSASDEYIARVDRMRTAIEDGRLALQRENQRQREIVKMALAKGSYFRGLAIVGEDGVASRDVKLVITEVRSEGDFVKGVVTMDDNEVERTKHFVGSLVFEKTLSGREQGFLSLRTVSMDESVAVASDSPFFESNNVSQLRLRADGFRLEGDSRDLSFRLTRSL